MVTITAFDAWPEPQSRWVMDGLAAFNASHGTVSSEEKLCVLAADAAGETVAGLLGRTDHGWLYVGWAWVPEALRGQGVGTRLMERAEAVARERGCHHAHLATLDYQARGFYEKLGYAVYAELENYPAPHTRIFMRKALLPR